MSGSPEKTGEEVRGYRQDCQRCYGEGCERCEWRGWVWERGNLLKPGFYPRFHTLEFVVELARALLQPHPSSSTEEEKP